MTRTDTILRLLTDGPLGMVELLEITGWTKRQLHKTMGCMTEDGRVIPAGQKGRYALNRSETPDLDGQHAGGEGSRMAPSQGNGEDLPGTVGGHAEAADRGHAVEFILPWPPTINTYWRTWQGQTLLSKKGREYRGAVARAVQNLSLGDAYEKPLAVHIEAWMPDKRVRDLDNLLKAPLDALTRAGFWVDDSQIADLRITRAPLLGGMLKVRVMELAAIGVMEAA